MCERCRSVPTPPRIRLDDEFVLDGWCREDTAVQRRLSLDPDAARWFGWTIEEAAAKPDSHYAGVLARFIGGWETGELLALAIRRSADGEPVGAIDIDPGSRNVAYLLLPDWRGRGIATRAVKRFVDWCARELGLDRFRIHCHVDNHASQRVAEKAGFSRVSREGDEYRYEYVVSLGESSDQLRGSPS
jgi:RimJ/RimL family protein N-acetyltransferase